MSLPPSFAAVIDSDAVSLTECDFSKGGVILIGNEGNGISDEVKATATHRVKLPMRGGAESLNAAIAAGIMMYDLMKDEM